MTLKNSYIFFEEVVYLMALSQRCGSADVQQHSGTIPSLTASRRWELRHLPRNLLKNSLKKKNRKRRLQLLPLQIRTRELRLCSRIEPNLFDGCIQIRTDDALQMHSTDLLYLFDMHESRVLSVSYLPRHSANAL